MEPTNQKPAREPLPSFNDCEGRTWTLRITKGRSRAILETCRIDFGKVPDGEVFNQLTADDETLAQVLWILCERQAGSRSITAEDFAESLDGDTLDDALHALMDATVLFTRRSRRAATKQMIRSMQKSETAGMQIVETWLTENEDEMIQQVTEGAQSALTSGKLLPNSPPSSASTPTT